MKKLLTILTAFICLQCFAQQHYPIKNMLGVNVHQWDVWYYDFYKGSFDSKYKALVGLHPSSIRIYLDADGEQDSFGRYAFNPSYHGGFQPETGIKRIKASNPEIFVQACYQRQTIPISKEWPYGSHINFRYQFNNAIDRQKPSSFTDIGHDLGVLSLRNGRTISGQDYPVFPPPQWYSVPNQMIKGASIYDAVEGGNEWNAFWTNNNFNSKELAAAWVTMYDSVKANDPSMLFTNGGIAADKPDTFLKAIDWWKNHGYSIPVDYFSYHSYPSAEGQYGWGTNGGLNPEAILYTRAKNMIAAVGQYKPVVVGEWGYDVHPESTQNAPAFSNYSAEETRAWWGVRAVLKFDQAGIYRAQWFRAYEDYINDDPRGGNYVSDNNSTQFATMALLRQYDTDVVKRTLVGDCFKQIDSRFGDYVFDKAIRDDSIQVLQFRSGNSIMLAAWSVESYTIVNNRPVFTEQKRNYSFNISGTRYDLNEDSSGVMKQQPFYASTVELSSKPLFILANNQSSLPVHFISFTAEKVSGVAVLKWVVEGTDSIIVERSADGRNFTPLGTGIFNKYVDMHPAPGNNYYRLKIESDGSISYSPIRTVLFNKSYEQVSLYNSIGQKIRQGWSGDVEHWKAELSNGVYFLQYNSHNEKFLKQQ